MCQYVVSNATLVVSNCVILLTGTGALLPLFFFSFYSFLLFPCLLCVRDAMCCDDFYVCKVTRSGRRRMLVLVPGVWECGGEISVPVVICGVKGVPGWVPGDFGRVVTPGQRRSYDLYRGFGNLGNLGFGTVLFVLYFFIRLRTGGSGWELLSFERAVRNVF